ncbi:MAG: GNAT family N-acetyltransferase [Pelagimonas sp.]|jgi:RimJ/RimL family protein N-acetyltransferase|nr:GNAT family N-acetyltransferase [Pelagimonas sp.]
MSETDFQTARLRVQDWAPVLADADRRAQLEPKLLAMLTPPVLKYLPPSLAVPDGGITAWIDARRDKARVSLIWQQDALIGLMFLMDIGTEGELRIGYMLAEQVWGQGIGSELVQGLIAQLAQGPKRHLSGGVEVGNLASARILQNAGFTRDPAQSSDELDMFTRMIG